MFGTNIMSVAIVFILIVISALGGFYIGSSYGNLRQGSTQTMMYTITTTKISQTTLKSVTYQLLPAISVVNFTVFNGTSCPKTCFYILIENFGKQIPQGSWKLFFRDLTHSKATDYLCNTTQSIATNLTYVCYGVLEMGFQSGDTLNVQVVAPNGAKAIGRVQDITEISMTATITSS
jgi:hypothetical protein